MVCVCKHKEARNLNNLLENQQEKTHTFFLETINHIS